MYIAVRRMCPEQGSFDTQVKCPICPVPSAQYPDAPYAQCPHLGQLAALVAGDAERADGPGPALLAPGLELRQPGGEVAGRALRPLRRQLGEVVVVGRGITWTARCRM
jgi:hypothetical protein